METTAAGRRLVEAQYDLRIGLRGLKLLNLLLGERMRIADRRRQRVGYWSNRSRARYDRAIASWLVAEADISGVRMAITVFEGKLVDLQNRVESAEGGVRAESEGSDV